MSNNPNFIASMSSDEIYFGQDMQICLTDEINEKAPMNHIHSEYAMSDHVHNGYATQSDLDILEDVVDTKANISHSHTGYASSTHAHSEYSTQIAFDILEEKVNGKANISHSHTGYASSTHAHSEYAVANHSHDNDYADIDHTHNIYATVDELNELSSSVSEKSNVSHSHNDVYYTENEVDLKLSNKSDKSHNHAGVYDVNGASASALISAKAYTDSKIDALVGEGASTTLDTIGEISSAIEDNQDAIDLLNSAIGNKANVADLTSHTSNKSNPHNVTLSQLGLTATASELNIMDGITAATAELNIMDGVTATTAEINYLDGVTSSIQTQLDAKASSSHTHNYAGSSSAGGSATSANKLTTARTISLTGDVTGSVSFDGSANASITATIVDDSHNHIISNVDGLQSALDGKASFSHTHSYLPLSGGTITGHLTMNNGDISTPNLYISDNGKSKGAIYAKDTTGTWRGNIQPANENNNCVFGYYNYDHFDGLTNIYGDNVNIYANYPDGGGHPAGTVFTARNANGHTLINYTASLDSMGSCTYIYGAGVHVRSNNDDFTVDNIQLAHTDTSTISSYSSGWTHYGTASANAPTVRRYGKVVSLTGALTNTSAVTLNTTHVKVFTIPSGYRPSQDVLVLCQGSGANEYLLQIKSDGGVYIGRYGTSSFSEVSSGTWFPFHTTWVME